MALRWPAMTGDRVVHASGSCRAGKFITPGGGRLRGPAVSSPSCWPRCLFRHPMREEAFRLKSVFTFGFKRAVGFLRSEPLQDETRQHEPSL